MCDSYVDHIDGVIRIKIVMMLMMITMMAMMITIIVMMMMTVITKKLITRIIYNYPNIPSLTTKSNVLNVLFTD